MKSLVKAVLSELGLLDIALRPSWHLRRRFRRIDQKLIDAYLDQYAVRKLQIGSGFNVLSGWLNSDYYPTSDDVLHLDATTRFSLPSDSFDYIFSEHMIEHVPYLSGSAMLRECHRVMKAGGKIRISTPNLQFVADLCKEEKAELQESYIKWSLQQFIKWAPRTGDAFVVNNFVRDWGHQFIYDETALRGQLEDAGFVNVERCGLGLSTNKALAGLENDKRMPAGFLKLETLTLEASKGVNRPATPNLSLQSDI